MQSNKLFLLLVTCAPLVAHNIEAHKQFTTAAVGYLVSTNELPASSAPKINELLLFGTEHEDDDPRYMFHFSPALNAAIFSTSCDSIQWGFFNIGAPCQQFGNPFGDTDNINTHTWIDVLNAKGSEGWVQLGFVLHLIQDLTSPAHIRNDPHPHLRLGLDGFGINVGDPDPIESDPSRSVPPIFSVEHIDVIDGPSLFRILRSQIEVRAWSKDRVFVGIGPIREDPDRADQNYFYEQGSNRQIAYKGWRYYLFGQRPELATIDSVIAAEQWDELAPIAVQYTVAMIRYYISQNQPDLDPKVQEQLTIVRTGNGHVDGPSGLKCGANCTVLVDHASSVQLSAVAGDGATFKGWGWDCAGPSSIMLVMNGNRNCTASFEGGTTTLTVAISGPGNVSSNPIGINCPGTCAAPFPFASITRLTAVGSSSTFKGWSGDTPECSGLAATITVTMDDNHSCTASFTLPTYKLEVRNTTGGGVVNSSPAGIDCGSTCSASYSNNTVVTLTATATSGFKFNGWSGDCAGTATTVQVTMSGDRTCNATFGADAFTLTVMKIGPDAGVASVTSSPGGITCAPFCVYNFPRNTVVNLSASNNHFAEWTGNCSGTFFNTQVSMTSNKTCTARFGYGITVTTSGSGTGTVTSSPSGINCGSTCFAYFSVFTQVTLTASPSPGSTFYGWGGQCGGTSTTVTVTVFSDLKCTARFDP
jgi:hypothetical protein